MGRKPTYLARILLRSDSKESLERGKREKTLVTPVTPFLEMEAVLPHHDEVEVPEASSLSLASSKRTVSSSDFAAKKVHFGSCSVRSYSQVMGEHPCCTIGCPIELGWQYEALDDVSVDDFEAMHQSSQRGSALRMTWEERRAILQGYSDVEVRRVCRRLQREALGSCHGRRASKDFFSCPIPECQSSTV